MNAIEVAQALIATIVDDNPRATEAEVDSRIGELIESLATERAGRAQMLAQLKVEFFEEKQVEFEAFAARKISERAVADAEALFNVKKG